MSFFRDLAKRLLGREYLVLLLLVGAVMAIYAPALNGQLVWDDTYLVGDNPLFRSPVYCLEVFKHYLYVDFLVPYYRPVQNLSFIWDYWLWRGNPFGYHLTNLILHGFSAFFLFLVLKRVLPELIGPVAAVCDRRQLTSSSEVGGLGEGMEESIQGMAFLVALIWAVHPIHNAAVAYISGRADSLISFFALLAWLLFLKGESVVGWRRLVLSLGAGVASLLALCSKEAGFLWIILFLFWVLGRGAAGKGEKLRRNLPVFGALAAISLCYLGLRHLPGALPGSGQNSIAPITYRIFLMSKAVWEYLSLLLWPADLHMERVLDRRAPFADWASLGVNIAHDLKALVGTLALLGMLLGMILKFPGRKLRVFGAAWFFIGFLPVSNLLPLNAQAAEHWVYMPSIGFLLFLAGVFAPLETRRNWMAAFVMAVTLPLAIRTYHRSEDWAEPQRFFSQTESSGGRTSRVYLNLSSLAASQGNLTLAEKMFRSTHERFPGDLFARINLGINLLSQNNPAKTQEAEQLLALDAQTLRAANTQFPYGWTAPLNLAKFRMTQNRPAEALAILDLGRAVYPANWELLACRAQILRQTGDLKTAVDEVQSHVAARWWEMRAWMMLGDLQAESGQTEAALRAWNQAARLDIYNGRPFVQMARYWCAKDQFQNALQAQMQAVERSPEEPSNFLFLASILEHLGQKQEARGAILRAGQLSKQSAN